MAERRQRGRSGGPSRRAQGGFTLVEILAAFVVFALLFATVLQVLSGSLNNTRRAAAYSKAALWAQSKMAAVGIDPPIEEGHWEGEFDDDYGWQIDITPYQLNDDTDLNFDEFPVDLYYVELAVVWSLDERPRRAVFRTLRTASPERG